MIPVTESSRHWRSPAPWRNPCCQSEGSYAWLSSLKFSFSKRPGRAEITGRLWTSGIASPFKCKPSDTVLIVRGRATHSSQSHLASRSSPMTRVARKDSVHTLSCQDDAKVNGSLYFYNSKTRPPWKVIVCCDFRIRHQKGMVLFLFLTNQFPISNSNSLLLHGQTCLR